jgi:F-type H+-transporting ATPase subunit gamma
VKVLLDAFTAGEVSAVYLCYNKFVSTMSQVPWSNSCCRCRPEDDEETKASGHAHAWDYIYEPDAQSVIDELLVRYVPKPWCTRRLPRTWPPNTRRAWWP